MSKKFLIVSIILLAGLIILLLWRGLRADNDAAYGNGSALASFAECLTKKNIVMYGTPWCSWCQKQKTLFGESFSSIDYVDCSKNPKECVSRGINATPSWIFPSASSGQVPSTSPGQTSSTSSPEQTVESRKIEGYLSLKELAEESGCELPK